MRRIPMAFAALAGVTATGAQPGAAGPVGMLEAPAAIVIDGDTLDLVTPNEAGPRRQRVRLWGMDAPERGEPGAREAAAWLALLLSERPGVTCVPAEAADQRAGDRLVATCWAGGEGSLAESLNCKLIAVGAAVEMLRFSDGALAGCAPQ